MRVILLRFDSSRKVIGVWEQEHDQSHVHDDLEDFTGHPDGPRFMRRTQLPAGSFSPIPPLPPPTRRQILKEKEVWTPADRDEAMKLLL